MSSGYRDEVRAHVEKHLGTIERVLRVTDAPDIDVLHVPPQETRPVHTLVTCGMSDRAMTLPAGKKDAPRYIELMMTLPRTWRFDEPSQRGVRWHWPVQQLGAIAQQPQRSDTWLGWGEVVRNGDPPRPFAPDSKLCGAVIVPSLLVPLDFYELRIAAHTIAFFSVLPLYQEEMALQAAQGVNRLFDALLNADIKDLIDPTRRNVARKKFLGLF